MSEKVLFVDDEPEVLESYERLLRREFNISIAIGAEKALATIRSYGPYAVVISDMRMPGMNGAEFLAEVRRHTPNTARILLTGYTDLEAAVAAINQGNILRFLSKPCEKEQLVEAIKFGLDQYRETTAEKDLVRRALLLEGAEFSHDDAALCPWDNFEGPTGLPGPSQARRHLSSLWGVDPYTFVILFKLTALQMLEQRYGEEAFSDYINIEAQFLMQALRSEDRLFHWGRDVLMAVVSRRLSPAALRSEISRLITSGREHVIEVNSRRVMVARTMEFDLLPVSQYPAIDHMLAAFAQKLTVKT
jgi:ActR/RegA family two-component response regulator